MPARIKLTPELIEEICEAIAFTGRDSDGYAKAGISRATFYRRLEDDRSPKGSTENKNLYLAVVMAREKAQTIAYATEEERKKIEAREEKRERESQQKRKRKKGSGKTDLEKDPSIGQVIIRAMQRGVTLECASYIAGHNPVKVKEWIKKGQQEDAGAVFKSFAEGVDRAEEEFLGNVEMALSKLCLDENLNAIKFVLERRRPERWGRVIRQERHLDESATQSAALERKAAALHEMDLFDERHGVEYQRIDEDDPDEPAEE